MFSYPVKDNEATNRARERVLAYIKVGADEQQRLIEYCARNIPRDRYVPPHLMAFDIARRDDSPPSAAPLVINYAIGPRSTPWETREALKIHKHALGQLCDISNLKRPYMTFLNDDSEDSWKRELLANNLNRLFAKQKFINKLKKPAEFLHRIVNQELRAVLTQSYNRHLVSAAVLRPFIEVCEEVGLEPARATITDVRVHLQTYLPFAFEPIPGEFVALGTCWGNSDFGEGKVKISHSILRLNGMGNLVTGDAFSRTHIGSVVEDTDLKLDEATAVKELEAVAAATKAAVREAMQPEQVQKILNAISQAHLEQVPWHRLRDQLGKFLTKDALGAIDQALDSQITELPPPGHGANGELLPSRWWAAAALAHIAEKQTDPARAMELKNAAGTFLAPK